MFLKNQETHFWKKEINFVHTKTKQFLCEKACKLIQDAKENWKKQLEVFVKERLIEGNLSIYNTIKEKDLALYRQKNSFGYP